MKRFYGLCSGIALVLVVTFAAGCVPLLIGAAVGAGSMVYMNGSLVQNMDQTVEELHQAILDGLRSLDIFVLSDELNRHSAIVKAEYEDGRKVDIKVDAITEYVSKVTIRVGLLGDQEDSRLILEAIEGYLN